MGYSRFTLGIWLRAVLIGICGFGVALLLARTQLYATALVLAAVGALLALDLARLVVRADRMLSLFIDGLAAGDWERPSRSAPGASGFDRLIGALDRAVGRLNDGRARQQRQLEYLQSLLDQVTAVLIVAGEDGEVVLANRAAVRLAGRPVRRLGEVAAIGHDAAARLLALKPGQREVLRLANGERVLAGAARFSAGGKQQLLLSLDNIGRELDLAELKAWQDLVRILAHEMMNSLTPIASLAQSIGPMVQGTSPDLADAVDAIARRSDGLLRFVERYREVADLPRAQLRPVELAALIGRLERLLAAELGGRGIRLSVAVDPAGLTLPADAGLLEQALINLVRNAAEALQGRPDGSPGGTIALTATATDRRVRLTVADNGPGLDPALLDRIFVPFFTTKQGGSGIGLSLVRQIAYAHGGSVEVANCEAGGASFSLLLPE